jgi:hypothetical protein
MKRLRRHALALGGIVMFAILPFVPTVAAFFIADILGCRLNEANAHTCVLMGSDIGGLLYSMALLGWLGIATISIAGIMLVPWAGWLVFALATAPKHRQ